jgi:hypothetical protein
VVVRDWSARLDGERFRMSAHKKTAFFQAVFLWIGGLGDYRVQTCAA